MTERLPMITVSRLRTIQDVAKDQLFNARLYKLPDPVINSLEDLADEIDHLIQKDRAA